MTSKLLTNQRIKHGSFRIKRLSLSLSLSLSHSSRSSRSSRNSLSLSSQSSHSLSRSSLSSQSSLSLSRSSLRSPKLVGIGKKLQLYTSLKQIQESSLKGKINYNPVENFKSATHKQVLMEVNELVWILVSFGNDGLEVGVNVQKQILVSRRKQNTLEQSKSIKCPTEKLLKFLKEKQSIRYNLAFWNCQHYTQALWNALTE